MSIKSPTDSTSTRTVSPVARALTWIGLDLSEPGMASPVEKVIYGLLVFVPVAILVNLLGVGGIWLFLASAAAIIPLAKILSTATEQLSVRVGPGIGGFLSA